MRIDIAVAIWLTALAASNSVLARDGRIDQAVFAKDKLWFVEENALWSADPDGASATKHIAQGVLGLTKRDSAVWIVRAESASAEPLTISAVPVRSGGELGDPALRLALKPQEAIKGIFTDDSDVFVLTTDRLASTRDRGRPVELSITGKIRGRMTGVARSAASGAELYLGFDAGEWGGGVMRLDLNDGRGAVLRSPDSGGLCEGTLNPDCHPASAVIPDPENGACVIAANGLWHFFENGSIVRICPGTFETVFRERTKDVSNSIAFSGLAPAKAGFWAVSAKELFKFENGKPVSRSPLNFQETPGGLLLARPNDEVLVLSSKPPRSKDDGRFRPILVSTLP